MSNAYRLALLACIAASSAHGEAPRMIESSGSRATELRVFEGSLAPGGVRPGDTLWINGIATRVGPEGRFRVLLPDPEIYSVHHQDARGGAVREVTVEEARRSRLFQRLHEADSTISAEKEDPPESGDIRDLLDTGSAGDIRDLLRSRPSQGDIRDLLDTGSEGDIRDLLGTPPVDTPDSAAARRSQIRDLLRERSSQGDIRDLLDTGSEGDIRDLLDTTGEK